MDYFENSKELVLYSKETLLKIEKNYNDSLNEKNIKSSLLIEIKNYMENLRSSLDYVAHGLYEKYGDKNNTQNIYFPYAWTGLSKNEFITQKIIDKKIPGLTKNRLDIAQKIESYQYFSNSNNNWLPLFMELNNENKHQKLTPQEKKEIKELNISSGFASVSFSEFGNFEIGAGASVQIGGDAIIPGGQKFTVNNPPKVIGNAKQVIITWVLFIFQSNNEPVLPLLKKSLIGVEEIVEELSII